MKKNKVIMVSQDEWDQIKNRLKDHMKAGGSLRTDVFAAIAVFLFGGVCIFLIHVAATFMAKWLAK